MYSLPTYAKIALLLFSMTTCYAQKVVKKSFDAGQLPWVYGDLPSNKGFYTYKVVQGQGDDLLKARKNTIQNLVFELGSERGVRISSETISRVHESIEKESTSFTSDFTEETVIKQGGFEAVFSKIDEYYEVVRQSDGRLYYNVWHLYTIGSNSKTTPKPNYTTKYTFKNAGFRSALLPGWGQFYKKKNTKGFVFVVAAAASVGTYVYANNQYNYNNNRLAESSSLDLKKEYSKRANNFQSVKNMSLGAMGVVWLWSIVDAIATEGNPNYASTSNFDMNLYKSSPQEALTLSLTYKF
jgi:hypothetical protein